MGWSPKDDTEKMSFDELLSKFSVEGINKSPSIFDPVKLAWLNGLYIKEMEEETFAKYAQPWIEKSNLSGKFDQAKLCALIHSRIETFAEIADKLDFLVTFNDYDNELFVNKKQKTTVELSREVLPLVRQAFEKLEGDNWNNQNLYNALLQLAADKGWKNGQVLWPARIAITGLQSTAGGASDIADILGKQETLRRLDFSIAKLG